MIWCKIHSNEKQKKGTNKPKTKHTTPAQIHLNNTIPVVPIVCSSNTQGNPCSKILETSGYT